MTLYQTPLFERLEERQLLNVAIGLTQLDSENPPEGAGCSSITDACAQASMLEYWSVFAVNGVAAVVLDSAGLVLVACGSSPSRPWVIGMSAGLMLVSSAFQLGSIVLSSLVASNLPEPQCENESGLQEYFAKAGGWGALSGDAIFLASLAFGAALYGLSTKIQKVRITQPPVGYDSEIQGLV